jgi:hypothetical protein
VGGEKDDEETVFYFTFINFNLETWSFIQFSFSVVFKKPEYENSVFLLLSLFKKFFGCFFNIFWE